MKMQAKKNTRQLAKLYGFPGLNSLSPINASEFFLLSFFFIGPGLNC